MTVGENDRKTGRYIRKIMKNDLFLQVLCRDKERDKRQNCFKTLTYTSIRSSSKGVLRESMVMVFDIAKNRVLTSFL